MRSRKSSKPEQLGLHWDTPGLIAGVDEAGRGPLAGPVVTAAVILDDLQPIEGLADSKVLTEARREQLFDEIRAKALCFSIAQASVEEIDRLNILQATLLAMRIAALGCGTLADDVGAVSVAIGPSITQRFAALRPGSRATPAPASAAC